MSHKREGLSSVHNALRILKEFTVEGGELGISELSSRLDLAKSTIFRLVKTLCENGMVQQSAETHKYYLGMAAFEMGFSVYHSKEIRVVAFSFLDNLMKTYRKVFRLGVYDRGEVIYLINRVPNGANYGFHKIGSRTPVYCTALGKVLLAHQSAHEIERFLTKGALKRYTPKTIMDVKLLNNQLKDIQKNGYGFSREEYRPGNYSVAVPVFDDNGSVVAAISMADQINYFDMSGMQDYVKELKTCSRLITERLGL